MRPPVPNLSKYIDLIEQDQSNLDDEELNEHDYVMQYEAEVKLFRALEKLEKNCRIDDDIEGESLTDQDKKRLQVIVLHGFEYKHSLFREIMPSHNCTSTLDKCKSKETHPCHKKDKETEGEADFIVIGENYFATLEVKHCKIVNLATNLVKAIDQAERTEMLLRKILEVIDNNEHTQNFPILKFCAFPFISRMDGQPYQNKVVLGTTKVMFEDDLLDINSWWKENVDSIVTETTGLHMSEEVKSIATGLVGADNADIRSCVKKVDEQLRKSMITRECKKDGKITHNNSEVFEVQPKDIQKLLGIKYFRKEQKAALDNESNHLTINGPAGSGKTKILQAKLLVYALNPASKIKPVLFSVSHEATKVHVEMIKSAGLKLETQKIGNRKLSSNRIHQLKNMTSKKVLIFSVTVINYSDNFLNSIYEVISNFKEHKIFMDDIQCFLHLNTIIGFRKLMRLLKSCAFACITMDVAQIFYYPSSAAGARQIKNVIDSIQYSPMIVCNLHENIRNSYEISSLLGVVRDELKKNFCLTDIFNSQRFSHFIHGPRPKVHFVRSSRRGKLADKIYEIITTDLKQLGLPNFETLSPKGNKIKLTNGDFQILRFIGPKEKNKGAQNHDLDFTNLNEYTTKIGYSYSREWAAVFTLLNINKETIYQEFLSRLYLGASRARVFCSVIIYVKGGDPPEFIESFLKRVEEDSMAINIKFRIKDESTKAQIEVASYHLNKKMRIE